MKGQFGPAGALFDGWETRRHNPSYDWAIIRLGPAAGAQVIGFDIDTANFNGNEAPEVEVFGLRLTAAEEEQNVQVHQDDDRVSDICVNKIKNAQPVFQWAPLLSRSPCQPSSRHLYALKDASTASDLASYTHIKLHMIPDGGIARFRVYGLITSPAVGFGVNEQSMADGRLNVLDLAHVMNGGRVVFTSDQHFGVGSNVLLPGRGKDMGDGWETKRSRAPGHKDWLIIKLSEPGYLGYAEIDTAHFLGNFPESVELHAINFDGLQPPVADAEWTQILPRSKTGPGRQHFFPLTNVQGKAYSHVRVTMHPDGGIKRVRIVGRRKAPLASYEGELPIIPIPGSTDKELPVHPQLLSEKTGAAPCEDVKSCADSPCGFLGARSVTYHNAPLELQAKPLTPAEFSAYGDVITSPHASSLSEQPHKIANQGTAQKYEALSDVFSSYPSHADAKPRIHVYRCQGNDAQAPFGVGVLERHQFTKQAFIPMSDTRHSKQDGYLVIVAQNGSGEWRRRVRPCV